MSLESWPVDSDVKTPASQGRMTNELSKRKACLNCYQKKVRCDYDSQQSSCIRCIQDDLDCEFRNENQKPLRHSIRENVQDLASRVQNLEELLLRSDGPSTQPLSSNHFSPGPPVISSENDTIAPGTRKPPYAVVKAYRGPNSPWSLLVDRAKDNSAPFNLISFSEKAARLADEDRSRDLSTSILSIDLLEELQTIKRDDLFGYLDIYAGNAPFPIVHYEKLVQVAEQIVDFHFAVRSGEICCVLLYMAFGVVQSENVKPNKDRHAQSATFFEMAWKLLPQLMEEADLWALKAMTLMVHYLQASSKPQQCWNLLGSASRMAIALGFYGRDIRADSYSAIELEEGNRAWWLCYIMEKTISTTFDYPSAIGRYAENAAITLPAQFPRLNGANQKTDHVDYVLGANEVNAVEFFKDVIELTRNRDQTLDLDVKLSPAQGLETLDLLRKAVHPDRQSPFEPSPTLKLRGEIRDLAYHNAIQVISAHITQRGPPLAESVNSARRSIGIITHTKTDGHTMCLWMWMYYGFTAAVVLFLQTLADPSHADVILDVALLSGLHDLCASLAAEGSEGCRRISDILDLMEKAAMNLMKAKAMKASTAKRWLETESEQEQVDRRDKIPKTTHDAAEVLHSASASTEADVGSRANDAPGRDLWDTIPQSFAWDEWDEWLEDWPLDLDAL